MLLNSICMLDVACCSPRATALEAAHLMRKHHTGDLVVVDDDAESAKPVGIITDRDIVVEVLAKGLDPALTLVSSLMRVPVVIASQGEDSSHALDRMKLHGVRRLPVVSNAGTLVGIITADDLLKHLAEDANSLVDIITKEQTHEQRALR